MSLLERPFLTKFLTFFSSWGWVVGFVFTCLFSYSHAAKKKMEVYQHLHDRYNNLANNKKKALLEQEELKLQINSQSDPLWVQLILMKGLGLVPEGQKKIHFYEEASK